VYAEELPKIGEQPDLTKSPSAHMLCSEARRHGVWIVGGSVPEREIGQKSGKEKLYNTCLIVNPIGDIVGKHRKIHLFDIDVPGKMTFKESDSLSPGEGVTIVDTPWGKLALTHSAATALRISYLFPQVLSVYATHK
jgi:omega-amidase